MDDREKNSSERKQQLKQVIVFGLDGKVAWQGAHSWKTMYNVKE